MQNLKKITWSNFVPAEFACFVCRKSRAEYKTQLVDGNMVINVCLCEGCLSKPESQIKQEMLHRKEKRK